MVRLVDDHERVGGYLRRPAARVARDACVGDGDAMEVARWVGAPASGCSCTPRIAAAAAHWRVSGVVGQSTATRLTIPFGSRSLASSSAGRVLPAPGAAEMRNGPSRQSARRSSARCCHVRRDVDWERVKEPGILRHAADGSHAHPPHGFCAWVASLNEEARIGRIRFCSAPGNARCAGKRRSPLTRLFRDVRGSQIPSGVAGLERAWGELL